MYSFSEATHLSWDTFLVQKYPESHLWDTPEGDAWLRLFVLSTLYTFGLGCNIGADRISRYFKQLGIDTHIGISPDSLRKRFREIETVLADYQTRCEVQST